MFGPQHLPHLIRYFDGIDATLSRRLLRRTPPHEPSLTEEFCALMDAETQRAERLLEFGADDLNAALARCGDGLEVDVKIAVHPHSTRLESYVSQSDFGLVLEYENQLLPNESWSAAYLVQAKRLHRSPAGHYDESADFMSLSIAQKEALQVLAEILGEAALRYSFYCPPTSGLDPAFAAKARALHTRNLQGRLFDGALGLALRDSLSTTPGVEAGIWLTGVHAPPGGALALHDQAFRQATPFTWFLLEHFERGCWTNLSELELNTTSMRPREPVGRVRSLVEGDRAEMERLITDLGEHARDKELSVESLRILPASTITIRVSVLEGLEPDLRYMSL